MPTDLLLDDNLDLKFANGDFVFGESTEQHQKLLLLSDKCEFKEVPMRGVATRRFLEDHTPDNLAREIRQEFTIDGMQVQEIKAEADLNIQVAAYYKE